MPLFVTCSYSEGAKLQKASLLSGLVAMAMVDIPVLVVSVCYLLQFGRRRVAKGMPFERLVASAMVDIPAIVT